MAHGHGHQSIAHANPRCPAVANDALEREVLKVGRSMVSAEPQRRFCRRRRRLHTEATPPLVEHHRVATTLSRPRSAYTGELVAACDGDPRPAPAGASGRWEPAPTLTVRRLVAGFGPHRDRRRVVRGIDLDIGEGAARRTAPAPRASRWRCRAIAMAFKFP